VSIIRYANCAAWLPPCSICAIAEAQKARHPGQSRDKYPPAARSLIRVWSGQISQEICMGKKNRQQWTDVWANQTTLGNHFGLSALAMGRKLKELGLRGDDGLPTERALAEGYCVSTPLKDGTPFFMWNRQHVREAMQAHGYQSLNPQEITARELANRWVHIHRQWQKAATGGEEELLIDEAQDIEKETRRRGLTERVNALLRERNFYGTLLS